MITFSIIVLVISIIVMSFGVTNLAEPDKKIYAVATVIVSTAAGALLTLSILLYKIPFLSKILF